MENAQSSFISSTFWTERSGYVAGIKTLEIMEKIQSWKLISKQGEKIKKIISKISKKYNLKAQISGLDACPSYSLKVDNWLGYKTFITQELLKKNILGANTTYVSICHNDRLLREYETKLDKIFFEIQKIIKSGDKVESYLDGPVCHSGFKRLN